MTKDQQQMNTIHQRNQDARRREHERLAHRGLVVANEEIIVA